MLARTLDAHDRIVVPEETDFIIPAAFICHRVSDAAIGKALIKDLIMASSAFRRSVGWFLSPPEIATAIDDAEYSVHAIVSALYRRIEQNEGAAISGDKSPNDLQHLPILVETGFFERDVKIIHIVRDVRDVASSLLVLDWSEHDVERSFARSWSNANLYAHDQLHAMEDRYLLVKFEQMVIQPTQVFRMICRFLDVEYREEMLDPANRRLEWIGPHNRNLELPFLPSRAGAWKREMDPELRRRCERQADEALAHFGYLDAGD